MFLIYKITYSGLRRTLASFEKVLFLTLVKVWKLVISYYTGKADMVLMHCLKFCINVKDTLHIYSEIPLRKNLFHIETVQLICNANQLTGFYMRQGFTKICF